MWKMGRFCEVHRHLTYVIRFHIATNTRVAREVENGRFCEVHRRLTYVAGFYVAINTRVIRDLENGRFLRSASALGSRDVEM